MRSNPESPGSSQTTLSSFDIILAAFLALTLFGIYMLSFDGTLHSTDGLSMLAVTENLLKHGTVDTRQLENWESATLGIDSRPYPVFPIGPSLLLAPFLTLALILPGLGLTQTSMILMPLCSALTAIYLYLSARRLGYTPNIGLAVTLLAGLATMTWLRTRDLVADPLILIGFSAAFYYALAYAQDKKLSQAGLMGLALGVAILHKLVNAITIPFFLGYLTIPGFNIFQFKKFEWRAGFIAAIPVLAALLIVGLYNTFRFGTPLDSGFRGTLTFSTPVWIGFTGLIISPYKSLFLYIPLFVIIPFTLKKIGQKHPRELILILALLLSHMLVFGAWHDWGGGRNWGPRYLAPLNGLLTLLLLPFINQAFQPSQWRPRVALITVGLISLGMQILGISARDYAFLEASNYWIPPPHLSFWGELSLNRPNQWPIWGHLLRFNIGQIPVVWRWQWVALSHFDPLSLLAAGLILGLGLGGLMIFYGPATSRTPFFLKKWGFQHRAAGLWPLSAWLIALGCVALMLYRSYDDPRSIKEAEKADKLWPAYSALATQLPDLVAPHEAVIFTDRRFEYYLLDLDKSPAQRYVVAKPNQPEILETVPKLLRQDLKNTNRIWLVTDALDNRQLAYALELWLHERARPVEHYRFGESVQLTAFAPDPAATWEAIPPEPVLAGLVDPDDQTFNGIASLLGWDWPGLDGAQPLALQAGQSYGFELYWIYRGKAPEDLFFIRLLDVSGQPVVEVTAMPRPDQHLIPGQLLSEAALIAIPETASAGLYRLQIGFFTPAVESGELIFSLPPEITEIQIGQVQEGEVTAQP